MEGEDAQCILLFGRVSTTDQLVIILGDDAEQRELLKLGILHFVGARVVLAEHGEVGLVLAQQLNPDLVLLDLQLPQLGGCEVWHRSRPKPLAQAGSVVTVTALMDLQHQQAALAGDGANVVTKPIDVWNLTSLVRHHLAAGSPTGTVGTPCP